eukprot:NODE_50_length_31184_cov_0.705099.p33 type:complete len:101 gc:universal NODE_50_length_31184_cov_0.705099:3565-3263(-)
MIKMKQVLLEEALESVNLTRYLRAFLEYGIDDRNYKLLNHQDLKEMGITIVGHRIKIIKSFEGIPLTPIGNIEYAIQKIRQDAEPLFKIASDLEQFLREK